MLCQSDRLRGCLIKIKSQVSEIASPGSHDHQKLLGLNPGERRAAPKSDEHDRVDGRPPVVWSVMHTFLRGRKVDEEFRKNASTGFPRRAFPGS